MRSDRLIPGLSARLAQFQEVLRRGTKELGNVVLPTECAGCGAWDEVVCATCFTQMLGEPKEFTIETPGVEIRGFGVARYEAEMRRLVVTQKHDRHRDLGVFFEAAGYHLAVQVVNRGYLGSRPSRSEIFVVKAPSTNPRRSSRVSEAFAAGITAGLTQSGWARRAAILDLLEMKPGTTTQAGLSRTQRASNRHHRMRVVGSEMVVRRELRGAAVVLVDDVRASGATLQEMVRALQAVGAEISAGFVFAATAFSSNLKPGGESAAEVLRQTRG